jgi:hypothetical protein
MELGSYGGRKEVPFVGLEGEYVNRPAVTEKFGRAAMDEFNRSLDPSALGGTVNVIIHNPAPNTWAEVTRENIHPEMKNIERHFETAGSPF